VIAGHSTTLRCGRNQRWQLCPCRQRRLRAAPALDGPLQAALTAVRHVDAHPHLCTASCKATLIMHRVRVQGSLSYIEYCMWSSPACATGYIRAHLCVWLCHSRAAGGAAGCVAAVAAAAAAKASFRQRRRQVCVADCAAEPQRLLLQLPLGLLLLLLLWRRQLRLCSGCARSDQEAAQRPLHLLVHPLRTIKQPPLSSFGMSYVSSGIKHEGWNDAGGAARVASGFAIFSQQDILLLSPVQAPGNRGAG
jgi:hypothetical protein